MELRIPRPLLITLSLVLSIGRTAVAQTDLTPYEGNPIISVGQAGSWDAGIAFLPRVVYHQGTYYLFYTGSADMMNEPLSIGYATSTDGLSFDKSAFSPILTGDGSGFDAYTVAEGVPVVEDSTWTLYYNARPSPGAGPGPAIGRATADLDPSAIWVHDENPVLEVGGPGEWDSGFVAPCSVIRTGSGYVMYYSGSTGYPLQPSMVGLATSPDGIVWTKHDDPTTADPPYAESDPVLSLGPSGDWDSGLAWECSVMTDGDLWEMYYTGDPDSWTGEWIGYATSPDGIEWTKYEANPLLGPEEPWATQDVVAGAVIRIDSSYSVYYAGLTSFFNGEIGVALSPTTGIGDRSDAPAVPRGFTLAQNHPNPFNPRTTIRFGLDRDASVRLRIYTMRGEAVRTLVDRSRAAGEHEVTWDGTDDRGESVPSGAYIYRLELDDGASLARKMVILE